MTTSTQNKQTSTATPTSSPLILCKKCKSPHFAYQLACKRCGNYLLEDESLMGGPDFPIGKVMAVAGICIALVGICGALKIF